MTQEVYTFDWLEELRINLVEGLERLVPEDRIFKFSIPDELTDEELSPVIKINLISLNPNNWAGDKVIGYHVSFLIDTWHNDYVECLVIAQHIEYILRDMNSRQSSPIIDEDEDTKMYRNSRTYEANILI